MQDQMETFQITRKASWETVKTKQTYLIFFFSKKHIWYWNRNRLSNSNNSTICNNIIRRPIEGTHEEADTKLFVHLKHAIQKDSISSARTHANNSDIIFWQLPSSINCVILDCMNFGGSFGRGHATVWFPIHDYATKLGTSKSNSLLFSMDFVDVMLCRLLETKTKNLFFSNSDLTRNNWLFL